MPLKLETESSKVESKIVSEQNESTVSEQNESTESEQKESSKEHANKEEKDAATDEPKETEKADTETKEEIKEEPKESAELSKNEILIKSEKDEKNVTNEQLKSVSYWEKLKISLQPSLPKDLQIAEDMNEQQVQLQQQALSHFWAFLKGLLLNSSTEATNVDKKTE